MTNRKTLFVPCFERLTNVSATAVVALYYVNIASDAFVISAFFYHQKILDLLVLLNATLTLLPFKIVTDL